MKINHLSAFSMLLMLSLIISACATNHEVEKRLIGKWNPVTVENLTPQSAQSPKTQTIKVDTSTSGDTPKVIELTLPANPDKKGAKIERAMANEMNSPVIISMTNDQKTVEKNFPGKTVKGSWKLKKNGKCILVKVEKTGKTFTLDIISLTDSTAVVLEKLSFAEFKVKYAKQK